MTWYKVGKESSMKDGDLAKVKAGDKEVLIIRDGGVLKFSITGSPFFGFVPLNM